MYVSSYNYVHTRSCINIFVCTRYIHVHALIYFYVHDTYTFMNVNISMHVVQTRLYSFTTTLHSPSVPDQPCYACVSQLRAGFIASKQPPSCHQSFQLTDHPGVACHAQTATATGLPHTHCCHACHLPQEKKTTSLAKPGGIYTVCSMYRI
jgi:hypothetical protein